MISRQSSISRQDLERSGTTQLWTIKAVIFVAFIAMSLPYTILPELIINSSVQDYGFLAHLSAQTKILLIMSVYPLGMFLGAYMLGVLSDLIGKRLSLLMSLAMVFVFQLACGISAAKHQLIYFTLFRFFCGLFEGNISIARASIAVICQDEGERKVELGQANIALTLGWVLGPPIGALVSYFSSGQSFALPFFFGAFLAILALTISYFFFIEPTVKSSGAKSENIAAVKITPKIITLLIASFFLLLGVDSFYIFIPIYLTIALKATPVILSISSVTVGLSNVVSNYLLLPRLHRMLPTKGTILIISSLLACFLILLGLLPASCSLLILLPFFGACIALLSPNITTFISMKLSSSKQGLVMGVLSSQRTLGVAALTLLYSFLSSTVLKLPFLMGSIFLMLGMAVLV